MNFKTICDLNSDIYENLYRIPETVDLVVGIPRSGMLLASIIALYINKPLVDLEGFIQGNIYNCGNTKNKKEMKTNVNEMRSVLIVEDSCNSGRSLREVKRKLEDSEYKDRLIYLAAYVTESTKDDVDYYFEVIENPRKFEWNIFHSNELARACVDIDGVLCVDPTETQNDDGESYINFLLEANRRMPVSSKIGAIVTSRLEKYRPETEKWLKMNKIEYDQLYMLPLNSKEERIKQNASIPFKAEIYQDKKYTIFIESSDKQASEIAKISKKCVFCVDTQTFYEESSSILWKRKVKRSVLKTTRNFIPTKFKILIKKMMG